MFQLDEFMNGLDRLYENGRMDLAEEYLLLVLPLADTG